LGEMSYFMSTGQRYDMDFRAKWFEPSY